MNFVSDIPQSAVMEITPEIAKDLLLTSPGNRRIRSAYVQLLAAAMKRGDWMVTSQGIGIDNQGRLRDAHHRLNACVLANTSFKSTIVWGLPQDAYQVTDRGMVRSYEDILDCSKPVAEVLRLAGHIVTGNGRPSRREIDPLIHSGFKDLIEALIKYCSSKTAYFSSATFKLGAAVQIANNINADFVYSQYRALVLADYDKMTCASKALTRQVTTGNGLSSSDRYDVLARALTVFDPSKAQVSKIQISEETRPRARDYAQKALVKFIDLNAPV